MLNIISTKIIIGPPCNAILGLGELYANALQPGGRASSGPVAGGAGQAAEGRVLGRLTSTLALADTDGVPVGPPTSMPGGAERPPGLAAGPPKSSRWHLGRAGVCVGVSRGPCTGTGTCVLVRLSGDWMHMVPLACA